MQRPLRFLVASLVALSAAVAGCVQPSGSEIDDAGSDAKPSAALDASWPERSVPWGDDHDHGDPAHHQNLSTPNFHVLGFDPLVTEGLGTTATGMGCGGIGNTTEGRRIAVVHTISTDVAFIVADVTDPTAPQMLGEYLLPNVVVWDATVTPDGKHALVGAYPHVFGSDFKLPPPPANPLDLLEATVDAPATFAVQPLFRNYCTGETVEAGPVQYLPFGPGLVMVGLQDPTAPQLEDWVSQPVVGPHSVSTADIDGTIYAMSSVTNLVHEASYYFFFEVVDTPAGTGKLVPVTVIQAPGIESPALNGHTDVELHKHPGTGQLLAYLANWDGGVAVYDMSTPQAPVPLGSWKDADMGAIHEALPLDELWDGKHYTIAGQEVGEPVELPSGWVYVLDTTDPANPVEVGRWTIPVKPKWDGGLQFSTHYVEVVGRTLFVANYHGGLWAVDLSDPTDPTTVGLFVPDRVTPTPHENCPCGPVVEDVLAAPDGTLTAWDGANGIYQLHFDASDPAPRPTEWPRAG